MSALVWSGRKFNMHLKLHSYSIIKLFVLLKYILRLYWDRYLISTSFDTRARLKIEEQTLTDLFLKDL